MADLSPSRHFFQIGGHCRFFIHLVNLLFSDHTAFQRYIIWLPDGVVKQLRSEK